MRMFEYQFEGNTVASWAWAIVVAIALLVTLAATRRVAVRRLTSLAATSDAKFIALAGELATGLRRWFLWAAALFVAATMLSLPPSIHALLRGLFVVTLALQIGLWGQAVIRHVIAAHVAGDDGEGAARTTATFATFAARAVLWALLLLLLLDNLGVNIGSLLAGLGVGGVAVALAVQNVLGDVLASLSIALDRPFVVGDFIVVDSLAGTVEHIGLKTTRVRSLSGEQIVFSNGDLLRSRLHNYKHLAERRVVLSFGVLYQTTAEQLAAIPGMVREAVEATPRTRFDRAHLKSFAASSLDFEVVYYALDPDYTVHMDAQQEILLTIFRRFDERGIGFAYPTQTVYVQRVPRATAAPPPPT